MPAMTPPQSEGYSYHTQNQFHTSNNKGKKIVDPKFKDIICGELRKGFIVFKKIQQLLKEKPSYFHEGRRNNTQILHQTIMEMIPIILYYNGIWIDDIVYTNFKVSGLLVQDTEVLANLENLVRSTLDISSSTTFTMKFHISPNIPPISVRDDSTLRFYIEVCRKNSEYGKYPLLITEENTLVTENHVQYATSMGRGLPKNFTCPVNQTSAIVPLVTNSLANRIEYADKVVQDIVESEKNAPLQLPSTEDQENQVISSTENVIVKEKQIYERKDVLMNAISLHSLRQNRQFKVQRSSSRDYVIVCVESTNCQWMLRASKLGNTKMFKVRKMIDVHTCSSNILMGNHRQASNELVSECIKDRFMNLKKVYTPLDIVEDMMKDYQIYISYQKAWRSKERALAKVRGNPHDYSLIPSWLYMVEKNNPGSITDISLDCHGRFKYLFFSLGPSIEAYKNCLPIIVIDGTFLNSIYMGTLLTTSTQDANRSIVPIAFGVVDSENEDSWTWFFKNLRRAVGVRDNQCIVSDRHQAIVKGLEIIFPDVMHGACTYHVLKNIKKRFKKGGADVKNAYNGACRAYTLQEFEKHMNDLDAIDCRIRPFLENEVKLSKCTRLHGDTSRFLTMTSNIAESLNNAIKTLRELPVTTMIECLRCLAQRWYHTNKQVAHSTFTTLATDAETRLANIINESKRLKVATSNLVIYTVYDLNKEYVVDLSKKTCTCQEFQYHEMPCKHASVSLCATYSSSIMPVGDKDSWDIPSHVKLLKVLPPNTKRPPGRPKAGRYKSAAEAKSHVQCGKCK
ncbi:hypothetical protein OROMI_007258 [Orobanche minor]